MEILSDAVFHGNVEAKEQIKVGNNIIRAFSSAGGPSGSERSEWILSDDPIRVGQVGASNLFSRESLTLGSNSIQIGRFNGNHGAREPISANQFCQVRTITFPSETSTLASTNDLKNIKTKRIILPSPPIPSTCSRFYFANPLNTGCAYMLLLEDKSEFFIKQVIDTSTNTNVQIDLQQTIGGRNDSATGYCYMFIGNLSTPHEEFKSPGKYSLIIV